MDIAVFLPAHGLTKDLHSRGPHKSVLGQLRSVVISCYNLDFNHIMHFYSFSLTTSLFVCPCAELFSLALREGHLDHSHIPMSSHHPAVKYLYHVHSHHISVLAGPEHPLRLDLVLSWREGLLHTWYSLRTTF